MCGIAGYIYLNNEFSKERFKQAAGLLNHRGPDVCGYYFSDDNKVGLAHFRLSILDLSSAADQPMFSANGRYCIVLNGEIYNYKELKHELSDKGLSLKTTSDTEVVLELFAQKGVECFSSLNGMYAFAIFDLQTKEITLCRDHVGIKPLFYYQDENCIVFASELKTIKSLLAEKLSINYEVIPYFLHLGFIPQPLTIYQQTYKFPSAHFVQLNTAKPVLCQIKEQSQPFWKLENIITTEKLSNEPIAKIQLNDLLIDAVEKQLISDVPIGTFLSGGIDSSIVTAIAAKISSHKKIKTFSIAIDDGKFNESANAKAVAKHLQTDHHEFKVRETEVLDLLDKFIPAYDEPFADSSAFPTMMVSRLAKQHVTVALSGDGGDELFHGYGMYSWARRLSNPVIPFLKTPVYLASQFMNSKYQRAGNMFDYPDKKNIITHIFSQESYLFKEQEIRKILKTNHFNFSSINSLGKIRGIQNEEEKQSLWDFNYYLKDDLLVKIDRASMQYSLESRVPLLDYRVVEFAYNLDSSLKIKDGNKKYLLKQVLYDYIPKEIFDRPKWGFSIPLHKWLKTNMKYLMDKYTAQRVVEKYNVFDFTEVQKLVNAYKNGVDYLYNRIWLIIVLHWWLEEN